MSRALVKSASTKQQVLAAAERQFARYVYSKVTMREVAIEAGLQKASLYYYFQTKEDLFQAVIEQKYAEFRARVEQILASGGPAGDRLRAYTEARFEYFNRLLNLNIVDFRTVAHNTPRLDAMFRRNAARELRWLCALFEAGMQSGEFAQGPARELAETFLHIHQGLRARVLRALQCDYRTPSAFSQLRREQLLVTGIFLNGIRAESPRRQSSALAATNAEERSTHEKAN